MELSNSQLLSICNTVIQRTSHADPKLQAYIISLDIAGFRPMEPLQPELFSINNLGYIDFQPLKYNNIRELDYGLFPKRMIHFWFHNTNSYKKSDYRTFLRWLYNVLPCNVVNYEGKRVGLYLFRFNFVRQLKEIGKTDAEIKSIMGWKSEDMVQRYLTTPLIIN